MFTTEQFREPCNCRSVGECNHGTFAWMKAIETAVDAFADKMKAKMREKALRDMKTGWDKPEDWPDEGLQIQLEEHVDKGFTHDNMIDVANYCMMLWNRQQPEVGPYAQT